MMSEDRKKKYDEYQKLYARNMPAEQKMKTKNTQKLWRQKNRGSLNKKQRLYERSLPEERKDKIRIKLHENHKKRMKKYKELVFEIYGDKCVCCGECNRAFLTIDHINGGGKKEKRELGTEGFYKAVVELKDKNKYQIMCFNCNCARFLNNGVCPHKTSSLGDI